MFTKSMLNNNGLTYLFKDQLHEATLLQHIIQCCIIHVFYGMECSILRVGLIAGIELCIELENYGINSI